MKRLHSRSTLLTLAIATIMGGTFIGDAEAGRGGGGMRGGGGGMRGGGGGMRGGYGGARTSVSRPSGGYSGGGNLSSNRNVNRNTNRNVDRNVNGDRGYYRGGRYYGGAAVGAAAVGVAAGATAVAVGSMAYSLPYGCGNMYYGDSPYYNCGGTYYQPQYSGSDVTYIVVEDPEDVDEDPED